MRSILEASSQRLAETNSLHFSLSVDGTTYIDDGRTIQLDSAEGNVVRPDKVQASFKAEIAGAGDLDNPADYGRRSVLDDQYHHRRLGACSDRVRVRRDRPVQRHRRSGYVMLNAVDPVKLPDEELNGRGVYRIQTTGDAALIGPVTSDTMTRVSGRDRHLDRQGDL